MNNLERSKQYYQLNKEKLRLKRKLRYELNKLPELERAKRQRTNTPKEILNSYSKKAYEKRKEKVRDYAVKRIEHNWEKYILTTAKQRAKKVGLEFNLTLEDIVIPEYCPYLGVKLTRELGAGRVQTNPSIDRIDNSKGYVKGNVQIISAKANMMKSNASLEELVAFAKGVLKMYE